MPQNKTLEQAKSYWTSWLGFWRGQFGTTPKTAPRVNLARLKRQRRVQSRAMVRNPPPVIIQQTTNIPKNDPKESANAPLSKSNIKLKNLQDVKSTKQFKKLVEPEVVYKGIPKSLVETPAERISKIEKKQAIRKLRLFQPQRVSKPRRQLLWINPGSEKIAQLKLAIKNGGLVPKWAKRLESYFSLAGKTLLFEGLPVVGYAAKVESIRALYFNPKEPSTIQPITDNLRPRFANISKGNVTRILRTFETYQRNFRRRLPTKVNGRMTLTKPGTILCDMFFPSAQLGWQKYSCLTLMDGWSRYTECYPLKRKSKKFVQDAALKFFQNFASLGHLPRILLMDKGTDVGPVGEIALKFRTDPTKKMVFHSQTGQPVNLVEQTQSQIQRRMQVFRTAGLTDDPREILEDICESINNQRRPERGNLTPLQLLTLNQTQRVRINHDYARKLELPEVSGLKPLFVGSRVRVLMMTRKEQLTHGLKGFAPKWSLDVYTVKSKVALPGNPNNFRYRVYGDSESYFRHELLKVPRKLDRDTMDFIQKMEVEELDDDEYKPEDDM